MFGTWKIAIVLTVAASLFGSVYYLHRSIVNAEVAAAENVLRLAYQNAIAEDRQRKVAAVTQENASLRALDDTIERILQTMDERDRAALTALYRDIRNAKISKDGCAIDRAPILGNSWLRSVD